MRRRSDAPRRARLFQFGRDLAHFLMVRVVLMGAGALVGALIGLAFILAGYGLMDVLAAGALIGAVVTLFISIPAVGGKASVRQAGEDILGFLLMFVLACAAGAAVGTVLGLLLVPWQGWGVVGVAAGIGAIVPLALLLSAGGGTDPQNTFRGFLRDVFGRVSAFKRWWSGRRERAVCPYCGQKQARGPDGTFSVCPHCGFDLRRDDYPVCRWCGEKHTFGPDGTDRKCDNCGGFRGDAYEVCPWCDEKHTFGPWGTSPVCSNCGLFREGV